MAMFFHGFRRFTEDVDILIDQATYDRLLLSPELVQCVLFPPGTSTFRHVELGVRVDWVIAGRSVGYRTPTPLTFPDPATASVEIDGLRILSLPNLLEVKLAAGMSHPGRLMHLGDVQQMIDVLQLSDEMANALHPWVREKYRELRDAVVNDPWNPARQ
jgi:hypothetical protein